MSGSLRHPAVAGLFYPAHRRELDATLEACFAHARPRPRPLTRRPRALVVPHAGYLYSGAVAASAYALVGPWRDAITRVALFGPSHRIAFAGLAVSGATVWRTPIGDVAIDQAADALTPLPWVTVDDRAHAAEHSLEVQVPFLQRVLGRFRLVPLVVGDATGEQVGAVVDALAADPATLIVVSTDLSHYEPADAATRHDRHTADAVIEGRSESIGPRDACGAVALRGLLHHARSTGLETTLVDLRNSGDTTGDHERVVGYGAFALT